MRIRRHLERHARLHAVIGAGVHVAMSPTEEAEEFVESALLRVKLRLVAKVRLSKPPGGITRGLQPIGERLLGERKADGGLGSLRRTGIELMPKPLLIPPRHQPRPRRTAIRPGNVPIRAAHAIFRKRIDIRRRNVAASVHTDVRIAHVV